MMMRILCILFISMQLISCIRQETIRQEDFNQQAVNLRRLANAVQGEVWRGPEQNADVLALACQRDPSLCEPFASDSVLVKVVDDNVILLLCDAGRKQALIEDAPCTMQTDRRAWEESSKPCEFTLDVAAVCGN